MNFHPVSYVKSHPVATIVTLAGGMMVGPWLTATLASKTGISISLPVAGNNN